MAGHFGVAAEDERVVTRAPTPPMATSSTETIAPKLSPCWPTGDATEAGDAELAGHVKGRDRAAEAELVCRLAPRVWPYGLRHLRDLTADDDLVQARTRMR